MMIVREPHSTAQFRIIHGMSEGCYEIYQTWKQPRGAYSFPHCDSAREIEQECTHSTPCRDGGEERSVGKNHRLGCSPLVTQI